MSHKLEDFIQKNKNQFDDYEPSAALWHRIEKKLDEPKEKKTKVFLMASAKWAAAAMIVLAIGLTFYALNTSDNNETHLAKSDTSVQQEPPSTGTTEIANNVPSEVKEPIVEKNIFSPRKVKETSVMAKSTEEEEVYHYTRLVQIKQTQIRNLKDSHPELYNQFADDLARLEFTYGELSKKLKHGLNNERLLEAMIQNLKMQAELLNKQLEITKQVKNNKNEKTINTL